MTTTNPAPNPAAGSEALRLPETGTHPEEHEMPTAEEVAAIQRATAAGAKAATEGGHAEEKHEENPGAHATSAQEEPSEESHAATSMAPEALHAAPVQAPKISPWKWVKEQFTGAINFFKTLLFRK